MFLYITVHLHLIASLSASSFSACFVEHNVLGGLVRMGMVAWNVSFQFSLNNLHLADVKVLPKKMVQMLVQKLHQLGLGGQRKGLQYV